MFGQQNDNGQPTDGMSMPQPVADPLAAAMPADPSAMAAPQPVPSTDGQPAPAAAPPLPQQTAVEVSDDLLDIKQQALQQLSPLVGHLDQTPEEKFRTTMMMIQASDNSELIKEAYTAAEQITDEKVKAQALLDIVNEINYFTSHQAQ